MSNVTDEKVKSVFASNLSQVMATIGISQAELSRLTGESEARLSSYRNGKKIPGIGVATRIADALGTTVGDLLGEKKKIKRGKKSA